MFLGSVLLVMGFGLLMFANAREFAHTNENGVEVYETYADSAFAGFENGMLRMFGVIVIMMGLVVMLGK